MLREAPPSLRIQLTKGLVDSHDMDTDALPYALRLDELVYGYTPDSAINDAVTMLVHVNTAHFIECDDILVLPEVRRAFTSL